MSNQLTQAELIALVKEAGGIGLSTPQVSFSRDALAKFAQLIQQPTSQESRQVEQGGDELVAACEELISQYESVPEFTLGGNLTNWPFLKIRQALANRMGGE